MLKTKYNNEIIKLGSFKPRRLVFVDTDGENTNQENREFNYEPDPKKWKEKGKTFSEYQKHIFKALELKKITDEVASSMISTAAHIFEKAKTEKK